MLTLSSDGLKHIQSVYKILKKIEAATNVPWQLLGAIWYRESFSVASPKVPGGPWQFDPPPAMAVINEYLDHYTNLSDFDKGTVRSKGVNDFYAGGILAGCLLQKKVGKRLTLDSPDDLIKQAAWAYNGEAYGSADRSPYVMNGYDDSHLDMHIIGSEPDGHGGRIQINRVDKELGAFTVYKQLKAIFP